MECIILAGGLGTRLRNVIGEIPKCMAVVNDKPFLHYLFIYLQQQQCEHIILSLGYKHEIITDWLAKNKWDFDIENVTEQQPLGTGGGMKLALSKSKTNNVFILNGDTFFDVDMKAMKNFCDKNISDTTIALKRMQRFERYGSVTTENNRIISFEEKKFCEQGLINGGVYLLNKKKFSQINFSEKFSFEKDYLEMYADRINLAGYISDGYFIDIGVPADYEKAQEDFKKLF